MGRNKDLAKLYTRGLSCCPMCHETKPMVEFHRNSSSKRGIDSLCKGCVRKARGAQTREVNNAASLGAVARFYLDNFDRLTQTEIAQECSVSKQRIQQLERRFGVCEIAFRRRASHLLEKV